MIIYITETLRGTLFNFYSSINVITYVIVEIKKSCLYTSDLCVRRWLYTQLAKENLFLF